MNLEKLMGFFLLVSLAINMALPKSNNIKPIITIFCAVLTPLYAYIRLSG